MKIGILGTGYVGLVSGACFAKRGHQVACMDVDLLKVEQLRRCEIPIYEPGLREIVETEIGSGNLRFTNDARQAIQGVDICLIAVGTPPDASTDGADMHYVLSAARMIGQHWQKNTQIVIKSTIPVGSHEAVRSIIEGELRSRGLEDRIPLAFNPEFLREGSAVEDCLHPDRIILGVETAEAEELLRDLYISFAPTEKILTMDITSAEMTKYASNSMLAAKISFINEIANICEEVGANIRQVRRGMSLDSRIGAQFLNPGCGYGGSCFPKDISALAYLSRKNGYDPVLLEAVRAVNQTQKTRMIEKIRKYFENELLGRIIAVWGLAFKPDTDDMRCAPAIDIVSGLLEAGAVIRACDPQAIRKAQEYYFKDKAGITYYMDPYETLMGSDALVVLTEWEVFVQADPRRMREKMKQPVVFDGRNIFDPDIMKRNGYSYYPVGTGAQKGAAR